MQMLDTAWNSCPVSSHSILAYNVVANRFVDDLIEITYVTIIFDENFNMFSAKYI